MLISATTEENVATYTLLKYLNTSPIIVEIFSYHNSMTIAWSDAIILLQIWDLSAVRASIYSSARPWRLYKRFPKIFKKWCFTKYGHLHKQKFPLMQAERPVAYINRCPDCSGLWRQWLPSVAYSPQANVLWFIYQCPVETTNPLFFQHVWPSCNCSAWLRYRGPGGW